MPSLPQTLRSVILYSLAVLSFWPVSAANWPQWRGPTGMGTSEANGVPTTWSENENITWKTALPGAGASSPIVWGDRIYLTSYTGFGKGADGAGNLSELKRHLLCLHRTDGRILWDKTFPAELPEQERIREDHGYASSTLAIDEDRLYAFFGRSGAYAFDHEGNLLWRAAVGTGLSGWGSATSPVLYKDLVIINASVESESLVALNRRTGKEIWRVGGIKESWNTPLLVNLPVGKKELLVGIIKQILAFDPDTGQSLWQCDTGIGWYMCPTAVAHEGVVFFIGGRTGGGLAIRAGGRGNVTETHRLWKINKGSNVSSPIYHQEHVYFAHENLGIVYCVNAQTGEVVYEERLSPNPGQFYPSPILADGRLYYLSREGRTVVLAAQTTFEQLAINRLSREAGNFNSSPAIAGNQLLLRSDRFLYCLGNSSGTTLSSPRGIRLRQ